MPPRIPKACRARGCRNTTTDPSGYCESHKSEGWKQYKPGQSRHQRGYGSKWDVIRERVLKRDKGLCQLCLRAARLLQGDISVLLPPPSSGKNFVEQVQKMWRTGKRLYGNASDLVTMIKTLSGVSLGSDLQPRGVWKLLAHRDELVDVVPNLHQNNGRRPGD